MERERNREEVGALTLPAPNNRGNGGQNIRATACMHFDIELNRDVVSSRGSASDICHPRVGLGITLLSPFSCGTWYAGVQSVCGKSFSRMLVKQAANICYHDCLLALAVAESDADSWRTVLSGLFARFRK